MKTTPTILAVDDSEMNIDMLMGILKKYDVIPALSGEDALEILQEEEVDLILLDIMMPGMDGFEVCRRIKADERTQNIPVMFITVKNSEHDILKCFELGIVDYVPKPFNAVELLARVTTHLELRRYQVHLENTVTEQMEQVCLNETSRLKQGMVQLADMAGGLRQTLEQDGPVKKEDILTRCLDMEQSIHLIKERVEAL